MIVGAAAPKTERAEKERNGMNQPEIPGSMAGKDRAADSSGNPSGRSLPGDDLGPFAPPTSYQFEEELLGQPPRPIPYLLREGRYARQQRRLSWSFFLSRRPLSSLLAVAHRANLGSVPLPLQYLHWIGLGCVVVAAVAVVRNWRQSGPYRYVVEGVPLVARLRELVLEPGRIVNSQPVGHRFNAIIEYKDPPTGVSIRAPQSSVRFRNRALSSFSDRCRSQELRGAVRGDWSRYEWHASNVGRWSEGGLRVMRKYSQTFSGIAADDQHRNWILSGQLHQPSCTRGMRWR
jgi:hypothetical protein